MSLALLPIAIACLALIYLAISDAAVMRISNRVSALLLVTCLMAAILSFGGWGVLTQHLASGGIMLVFGFLLFAVGGFGAGDAKAMAAVAILFLPTELAMFLVLVTLYGGALAILMMMFRAYAPARVSTHALVASLFNHPKKMPYGIAISAAALTLIPSSDLVTRLVG